MRFEQKKVDGEFAKANDKLAELIIETRQRGDERDSEDQQRDRRLRL